MIRASTTTRRSLALALGVCCAGASLAQDAPPKDQDDLTPYAQQLYDEGRLEEALEAAEAVLEEKPGARVAIDILRRAHVAKGDYDACATRLRALCEAAPEAAAPIAALAEARLDNAPGESEVLFRKALALDAESIPARVGLAAALAAQANREAAAAELTIVFQRYQAMQEGALDAETLVAMARAARLAEHIPALVAMHTKPFAREARRFYQEAFERTPKDVDLLVGWASLYQEKWDLTEARRLLKKALELNPRHADANALLAESHLDDLYGGTESYALARQAIDNALARNPHHVRAHILMAELLVTDALYDEALRSLAKALAVRPYDPRALADKVGILIVSGSTEADFTEESIKALPAHHVAEFYRRLAAILDQKFRYEHAHAVARAAVEADPSYWPAYTQLALAAMRTGDEAEARTYLERAHASDPFDLYAFNLLNLLDYIAKEFESYETEHFVVRVHKDEMPWLRPFLDPLLERSWSDLAKRYEVDLKGKKILFEVYPRLADFSVRAVAHRFIPASGVTFARVVALASPAAFPPGTHGWGRVLWHELAHVATLERTQHRMPRWIGEGISVYEESRGHPAWEREWDTMVVDALARGRLLPILDLDQGFSKPRFPNQVMLSYYQGGLICRFVEKEKGFPAILALLDGYRDGLSLPENLQRAVGMDPETFDRRFLDYCRAQFDGVRYRPPVEDAGALAQLRRAAKARPKDLAAQVAYALGCCDQGRGADAETAVGKVLALAPDNGDAKLVDARVALMRGQGERAAQLANEAIARNTTDPLAAHLLRAEYYGAPKERGSETPRDARQAAAALEEAQRLFPRNPAPLGDLARIYDALGNTERATITRRVLASVLPNDVEVRIKLADVAFEAGRVDEAAKWLEELIWILPQQPRLHALRAVVYMRAGATKEAEEAVALVKLLDRTKNQEILADTIAKLEVIRKESSTSPAKPPPAPKSEPATPTREF